MSWQLEYQFQVELLPGDQKCIVCSKASSWCTLHRLNPLKNASAYAFSKAKDSAIGGIIPDEWTKGCSNCREVVWRISVQDDECSGMSPVCTQCKEAIEQLEEWYTMGQSLKDLLKKLNEQDDDNAWSSTLTKMHQVDLFWKEHIHDQVGSAQDHVAYKRVDSVMTAWDQVSDALHHLGDVQSSFDLSWFG